MERQDIVSLLALALHVMRTDTRFTIKDSVQVKIERISKDLLWATRCILDAEMSRAFV
jgi:hypothetical protein